jgi:hypothetical protein
MYFLINRRQVKADADSCLTARFARDTENAEKIIISFAAETPANENTQPLRGNVIFICRLINI